MTQAHKFLAGIAAAAIIAGTGGYFVARSTGPGPTPAAVAAPAAEKPDGDDKPASNTLEVTPAAIRSAEIIVATADAGGLAAEILASATVTAQPQGQAILTARAAGAVTRITKRLGDRVRRGETLAIVESQEAAQIAADRRSAEVKASLAGKTLARERSLFQQRVSPRVDLEQAEAEAAVAATEAQRTRTAASAAGVTSDGRGVAVTSPIAGQISSSSANLGAFVQPETELFRVADPRRIQVEAAVASADAPRIRAGDRVVIELADGSSVPARVRAISSTIGTETRSAVAIIEPRSGDLRLGQTLRVRIFPSSATGSSAIVVPEEAVQSVAGGNVVFVRTDTGFVAQPVTTGQRSAGRIEITGGLKPGTRIATTNAFVLKAELGKGAGEEE